MNIQEKIRKIKESRLKPEERFLLNMIDGIECFSYDEYPNSVFWKKDDIFLFEQRLKDGWLWCKHNEIWSVFKYKYGYTYDKTQLFIKSVLDNDLRFTNKLPYNINNIVTFGYSSGKVLLGGLTPNCQYNEIFNSDFDEKLKGLKSKEFKII